jgi:hypothetical protein
VEGRIYNGTTSDTGLLEINLPARARTGLLKIPEEQLECELQFGWLDPLDEITGAEARLQNLSYYHGDLNGEMNDDLQEALEIFQSDFGLPVTGELDDVTKQKVSDGARRGTRFPAGLRAARGAGHRAGR